MNVGVGVGGQELTVTDEGIVEFDLGDIARAGEGERGAFGIDEGDEEIVDADEASGDFAGGGGDGDGGGGDAGSANAASATAAGARHEPGLLELLGVGDAGGDAVEVGVATGAGFGEVGGASGGVAGDDGGRGHAGGVIAANFEVVDEGGNVSDLRRGEVELGHAFAALANNGSDEFTVLVIEDEGGADEVGSAGAAAGIDAVAEGAVNAVDGLTAFEGGGVGGWSLGKGGGATEGRGRWRGDGGLGVDGEERGNARGRSKESKHGGINAITDMLVTG